MNEQRYHIIYRRGADKREIPSCFTYPWHAVLIMVRRSREPEPFHEPLRAIRVEAAGVSAPSEGDAA
jgi:hypothetical protein